MLRVNNLIGFGAGDGLSWLGDLSSTNLVGNKSIGAQVDQPFGCHISPDGTKYYVYDATTKKVFAYTLSTPFNITTASYTGTHTTALTTMGGVSYIYDISFDQDGTKLYAAGSLTGTGGGRIIECALSTPWDISSISHTTTKDISAQIGSSEHCTGGHMSYDGAAFYAYNRGNGVCYQYELSTPFSISSMSYSGKSFDTSNMDHYGLYLASNGTMVYFANSPGNVLQYELSTPWDISTAALSYTFTPPTNGTTGVCFDEVGSNIYYVVGSAIDSVTQYSIL